MHVVYFQKSCICSITHYQPMSMFEAPAAISDVLPSSARDGRLARLLGHVTDWCIIGIALLIPLWFLPITLDILELSKQTLLVGLVMLALIAWVGKALVDRSFSVTRSWMHLVVLVFALGYLVTSWFSVDRYLSFVGSLGQMQWAFSTVAALVLMYIVMVNRFRSAGQVYDLVLWFLLGSALAGIYGLMQMFGIHLIGGIAGSKTFNSVGTVNALGVFMVVPTVLAASLTVLGCREKTCILSHESWKGKFWHGVIWATLVIGLLTAVTVDYWVVWAGLLFGDVLLVAVPFLRTRRFGHPVTLAVPAILALLSILLLLFRTPINLQLPSEVSPSAGHTWQIAQQALRDKPLFGTGPGTWSYDYAKYRSVAVNLSQFWNIRFERGLSTMLTLPAMLGIVGTALWLILAISAVVKSGIHLVREKNDDLWQAYLTVFVGWITLVFLAFVYNYNVAHHTAFWFLLALLGVMVTNGEWKWDQRSKPLVSTILSVAFLLLAVGAISMMWLAGQRLVADAKYSSAVQAFQRGEDVDRSIERLEQSVALNPLNDAYPRNLSQAQLVKAGRMIAANPDAEASKAISALVGSAIKHAKQATEISPENVDNWANLAAIYQAISSFTRGADEAAIMNYEEALKREPNNPSIMNEVGKLYVLRSDAYRTLLQSPDEAARKDAEANVKTELDKAADWFNKAITAKPDYAEAHYNLGLVYERQGRINEAVTKLEQVLANNPQDVGVAFQLGTLYARANKKDAARQLFEQIVQAVPNYANARWLLSALYEEQGRYDEAIAQVQALASANQDNTAVTQRLEELNKAKADKAKPVVAPLPSPLPEGITGPAEQNPVRSR